MKSRLTRCLVVTLLITVSLLVVGNRLWAGTRPFKELAFVILASAVLFCALWEYTRSGRAQFDIWSLDFPVAVLLCWVIFSAFVPPRRWAAAEPCLVYLLLAGLVFVARRSFLSYSRLRGAATVVWGIGVVVAAFGLVQYSEIWPNGNLLLRVHSTGRIYSTMGNPNLLASLLAGSLLASLGLVASGPRKTGKVVIAAGMLVMAAALALCGSRGSIIGLVAGLAAFLVLSRRWNSGRVHEKGLKTAICGLVILTVGLVVFVLSGRNALNLNTVIDPNRQFIWRGAVRMFLSAPVTGYGVGRFGMVFPTFHYGQHVNPDFAFTTSHAHCEPLQIATELGITGLILAGWAFIACAVSIARVTGPVTRRPSSRLVLGAGLTAGVVAILGQSLVSVNTRWIQVSCPAAVMMGLALAAVRPYSSSRRSMLYTLTRWQRRTLRLFVVVFSTGFLSVLVFAGHKIVRADIEYRTGRTFAGASGEAGPLAQQLAEHAVKHLEASVHLNPYRTEAWYTLGGMRQSLGDWDGSLKAYDKVCQLIPDFGRVHLLRGQALLRCGRRREAISEIERDSNLYRTSILGRRMLRSAEQKNVFMDDEVLE